jgi:hypothetical protein
MVATKTKTTARRPKAAEQQEALLQNLSPRVQERVKKIRAWFAKADRSSLQQKYELGTEVKAIFDDKTQNGTGHYGLRLIANLSKVFGWETGLVYASLAVARAIEPEEVNALYDRPMANGRLISFGHLRALVKVALPKSRASLLDKALTHSWTREELEDAILQATTGQQKEDGRGRPLKAPKDLRGLLRQQERTAGEFVRRATDVWEAPENSLFRKVKQLSDKEVTEEQVETLKNHATVLRQLIAKATDQAQEAESAADYLEKKLTSAAEAAAASSNGESPRSGKSRAS